MYREKPVIIQEDAPNYFQVLGLEEEDSLESIREAYLQKVKENPPEERPEEFKRIREAYEILNDPEKRREYVLHLQHGESIRELEEESRKILKENPEKALKLLKEAQRLAPEKNQLYYFGCTAGQLLGDEEVVVQQLQLLEEYLPVDNKGRAKGLIMKADIHFEREEYPEALQTLKEAEELGVEEQKREIYNLYGWVYMRMEEFKKAAQAFDAIIPPLPELKSQDLSPVIDWIHALFNMRRFSEKPLMKKRIMKIVQSIDDKKEKELIQYMLWKEHQSYREVTRFQESEFFVDLLYKLDKDKEIRDLHKEIRELALLEKDHERMWKDERLFPLVVIRAHELFAKDFIPHEDTSHFWEKEEVKEHIHEDEAYAAGILRLKKKYKNMYRYYKKVWDKEFKQRTADLNREARRRLR